MLLILFPEEAQARDSAQSWAQLHGDNGFLHHCSHFTPLPSFWDQGFCVPCGMSSTPSHHQTLSTTSSKTCFPVTSFLEEVFPNSPHVILLHCCVTWRRSSVLCRTYVICYFPVFWLCGFQAYLRSKVSCGARNESYGWRLFKCWPLTEAPQLSLSNL